MIEVTGISLRNILKWHLLIVSRAQCSSWCGGIHIPSAQGWGWGHGDAGAGCLCLTEHINNLTPFQCCLNSKLATRYIALAKNKMFSADIWSLYVTPEIPTSEKQSGRLRAPCFLHVFVVCFLWTFVSTVQLQSFLPWAIFLVCPGLSDEERKHHGDGTASFLMIAGLEGAP